MNEMPGLHPALHRVLLQHVVDREVLAGVPEELEQVEPAQPVGVVEQPCRMAPREVEELLQLAPDGRCVRVYLLRRQHRPLIALAARVADHSGAAPDQRHRRPSGPLQPGEAHHRHQVPDVQRVRRRVEPDVRRDRAGRETFGQAREWHRAGSRGCRRRVRMLVMAGKLSPAASGGARRNADANRQVG